MYSYDVCTGRGEGGTPKADAVRKLSKGGCVTMQTRGEGVKKSENFADIIILHGPLVLTFESTSLPEMPKSQSLMFPAASRRMLDGLTSRWMTPWYSLR